MNMTSNHDRCTHGRHALLACLVLAISLATLHGPAQAAELRFDFTGRATPGAVAIQGSAPLYDTARGYGFVDRTAALPARPVHTEGIRCGDDGCTITEAAIDPNAATDHYNNFGMAFRIRAAPGAYAVQVRTTSNAPDSVVSVTGMQTSRLTSPGVLGCGKPAAEPTRVDGAGARLVVPLRERPGVHRYRDRAGEGRRAGRRGGNRADADRAAGACRRRAAHAVHAGRLHREVLHLRRGADERLGPGVRRPVRPGESETC
jgi:hypothetical protein